MVFISVLLAFLYAVVAAILVKGISNYFLKYGIAYEIGFFVSAIVLGGTSLGILQFDIPYGTLNLFLKAGITFSIIQLLMLPVLLVLKRTKKQTYNNFISWFEQTL